jgi:hypothetical protein
MQKDEPYRFITVNEFAEAFQCFQVGRKIGDELAVPFDKTKNHPSALATEKYGANKKELLKANFSREYLLMKRNAFVYIFKLSQVSFISCIQIHFVCSILFLNFFSRMHDFFGLNPPVPKGLARR